MVFVTWRRETFPHLPSLRIRTESQKSSSSSQFNTRGFHNCVNSLMKHYKLQHPGKTRILTPTYLCSRQKSGIICSDQGVKGGKKVEADERR